MPIFICFKIHSFNLSSFFNLLEKELVRLRHRKVFTHSFFAQTVDNIYFTVTGAYQMGSAPDRNLSQGQVLSSTCFLFK